MNRAVDVFSAIPCLTERSSILSGLALQKKWFKGADKRVIGQYLQKFIEYNSNLFNFLGVKPFIIGTDQNSSLCFRTSEFVGTIPLRAPDTGKQIGDFVVMPRFSGRDRFGDYIEILDLLGTEISPEISDTLPLVSGRNFRPPLYLEAIKFISAFEDLIKRSWRKFDNIEMISNEPEGNVNWNKYILNSFRVENRLKFPIAKNILSEQHSEYGQLRFVFDVCKMELLSSNTPLRIKSTIKPRLAFLEEKLYLHKPIPAKIIKISVGDSPAVKHCKMQANKILNSQYVDSTAWRVDFSDVFEKFVQYIFKETAKETGGKVFSNYKFPARTSQYYSWELKHIEPDAIYQKNNLLVFIDAKYKSHLYNTFDQSDILKEDYRHDLHQVLAYSSFSDSQSKYIFLCYPSESVQIKKTNFRNGINQTSNTVMICGIPLKKESIKDARRILMEEINKISNIVSAK